MSIILNKQKKDWHKDYIKKTLSIQNHKCFCCEHKFDENIYNQEFNFINFVFKSKFTLRNNYNFVVVCNNCYEDYSLYENKVKILSFIKQFSYKEQEEKLIIIYKLLNNNLAHKALLDYKAYYHTINYLLNFYLEVIKSLIVLQNNIIVDDLAQASQYLVIPNYILNIKENYINYKEKPFGNLSKRKKRTYKRFVEKQKKKCIWCNTEIQNIYHSDRSPTLEHLIPKHKAKSDSQENLVIACNKCNNLRGNLEINKFVNYLKLKQLHPQLDLIIECLNDIKNAKDNKRLMQRSHNIAQTEISILKKLA